MIIPNHQNPATNQHKEILKCLKRHNANIMTMKESKIVKICKTWHDERIDAIIKKRRKSNPSTANEISFFLTDLYGIYRPDDGYHVTYDSSYHPFVYVLCFYILNILFLNNIIL